MSSCTCIIPFYNERDRILKVLDEVIKIKEISEIICVDDGSTDNTSELVKKFYPNIRVIHISKNSGKTEAVGRALQQSKGYYILLLDADLQNLNYKDVERAVIKVQSENTIDMIILRRINTLLIKLIRGDILVSGERILKKEDLQKILYNQQNQPKGYQLEFAINQYMITNNKKVYWMPSSAVNTWPVYKRGLIKGLYKIISMQVDILNYIGFKNYIKQVLLFAKSKV